jgi:competence protein ComEC
MDTKRFARLIIELKKWIVPICAGSIFVAVLFESSYTSPASTPIIFAVSAVLLLVLFYTKKQNVFLFLFLCMITISFAIFRFHQEKEYRKNAIDFLDSFESIDMPMQIVSSVDYREKSTKVIAKYSDARILVTLPKDAKVEYGDIVQISGTLTKPEPFETDTGRIFDYSGYLAKERVFFEIRYPKYEFLEKGESSFVLRTLFRFKEYLRSSIIDSHKRDERGLLLGILIGERGGIQKELQDSFIKTGTIHIVALSGYNVTIISEAIAYVLIPLLGVTFGIVGGAIAVVLFAIMTGLGATIVRATIMGLLAYLSRMTGKEFDIGRALLIAGSIMILSNPWILVFDVSFQLSFIATIGLVYVTPLVSRWFGWIKSKGVKEIVSATIATNLTVLPFVAYKMGIISLVSIPANILIAPLVPLAMLFGALSIFVFMIFPILSLPLVALSSFVLSMILTVATKGSRAPLSHIEVPYFSVLVVVMWYLSMIYWWYWVKGRENQESNIHSRTQS